MSGGNAVESVQCSHDWVRDERSDCVRGGSISGKPYERWMAFWCRRCLATATRHVTYPEPSAAAVGPGEETAG